MSEENEELDIVKSLELTAEGSYDEGYRKGRKEGIEVMRADLCHCEDELPPCKPCCIAAERLKGQK